MDDDLFAGVPRLEMAPSADGMMVGAMGGGAPCGLEIAPDQALAAGIWLLDAGLGRAAAPLEVGEIVGPSALRLAPFPGAGGGFVVTLDVGDEPAQVVLNRLQAMLAGEHLIACAIRAGARPSAQSLLDPEAPLRL